MKAPLWLCGIMYFLPALLYSQQTEQYALFERNLYGINPAYGGMEYRLRANGIYRSQWTGLAGQPESYSFNMNLPLYAAYGAAGFQMRSEEIGPRTLTEFSASYNFVLSTSMGIFSLGLRPTFLQWRWDGRILQTPGGIYEGINIDHVDPAIAESQLSNSVFDLDAGLHFQNRSMQAGIVAHQLFPSQVSLIDNSGYRNQVEIGLYGTYLYDWTARIQWRAAGFLQTDGRRWQSVVKIGTMIDEIYYGTIGLRGFQANTFDALLFGGGFRVSEHFWVYYNFGLGLSGLRSGHNGSHEILIAYRLNRQIGAVVPPKIIYNPRYVE